MTATTIDPKGSWRLYWGPGPLPSGATALGTITRNGHETGALIEMRSGALVQGNAGAIRSLPQADVNRMLDIVGVAEIAARSGVGSQTVLAWRRRHPDFPPPHADLAMGPVWQWWAVERWLVITGRSGR